MIANISPFPIGQAYRSTSKGDPRSGRRSSLASLATIVHNRPPIDSPILRSAMRGINIKQILNLNIKQILNLNIKEILSVNIKELLSVNIKELLSVNIKKTLNIIIKKNKNINIKKNLNIAKYTSN